MQKFKVIYLNCRLCSCCCVFMVNKNQVTFEYIKKIQKHVLNFYLIWNMYHLVIKQSDRNWKSPSLKEKKRTSSNQMVEHSLIFPNMSGHNKFQFSSIFWEIILFYAEVYGYGIRTAICLISGHLQGNEKAFDQHRAPRHASSTWVKDSGNANQLWNR